MTQMSWWKFIDRQQLLLFLIGVGFLASDFNNFNLNNIKILRRNNISLCWIIISNSFQHDFFFVLKFRWEMFQLQINSIFNSIDDIFKFLSLFKFCFLSVKFINFVSDTLTSLLMMKLFSENFKFCVKNIVIITINFSKTPQIDVKNCKISKIMNSKIK